MITGLMSGASWIAVLSTLHVAAQAALPDWARARGLAIPLTLWARLGGGHQDHAPAHHWAAPVAADDVAPTTIWIADDDSEENHDRFHTLMQHQHASRRAHGAFGWVLRHDTAAPTRLYESWHEASWLARLRHHDRVSVTEKALQDEIRALSTSAPQIHHTTGRKTHELEPHPEPRMP